VERGDSRNLSERQNDNREALEADMAGELEKRLEAAIELLHTNTATLSALLDALYQKGVVEKEAVEKATAYKELDVAGVFKGLVEKKSREERER